MKYILETDFDKTYDTLSGYYLTEDSNRYGRYTFIKKQAQANNPLILEPISRSYFFSNLPQELKEIPQSYFEPYLSELDFYFNVTNNGSRYLEGNFPIEGHHIILYCFGGSNDDIENLIALSKKDHKHIHFTLWQCLRRAQEEIPELDFTKLITKARRSISSFSLRDSIIDDLDLTPEQWLEYCLDQEVAGVKTRSEYGVSAGNADNFKSDAAHRPDTFRLYWKDGEVQDVQIDGTPIEGKAGIVKAINDSGKSDKIATINSVGKFTSRPGSWLKFNLAKIPEIIIPGKAKPEKVRDPIKEPYICFKNIDGSTDKIDFSTGYYCASRSDMLSFIHKNENDSSIPEKVEKNRMLLINNRLPVHGGITQGTSLKNNNLEKFVVILESDLELLKKVLGVNDIEIKNKTSDVALDKFKDKDKPDGSADW